MPKVVVVVVLFGDGGGKGEGGFSGWGHMRLQQHGEGDAGQGYQGE